MQCRVLWTQCIKTAQFRRKSRKANQQLNWPKRGFCLSLSKRCGLSEMSLHGKNTAKSTTRNRSRVKFNHFANVLLRARICCVRLRWNFLNISNKLSKGWNCDVSCYTLKEICSLSTENEILCVVQLRVKVAGKRSRRFGTIGGRTNRTAVHKKQTYQCICGMNFFLKLSIVSRPLRPRRNFLVKDKQVFLSDFNMPWISWWMTWIAVLTIWMFFNLCATFPRKHRTTEIGRFDPNFKHESILIVFHHWNQQLLHAWNSSGLSSRAWKCFKLNYRRELLCFWREIYHLRNLSNH